MENQKGSRAKDQTARVQKEGRSDLPNSNDGKKKRTRLSRSEQQGFKEEGHFHHEPISQGIGERVWFNRSIYEKADVSYQTLLSSGSGTPPIPPKERIPRTLVFRSKRSAGQPYQEEENYVHTRSFTSQIQKQGSTHHRSSSEPQRARHIPSGGRKRVYSETERASPRREKYG